MQIKIENVSIYNIWVKSYQVQIGIKCLSRALTRVDFKDVTNFINLRIETKYTQEELN